MLTTEELKKLNLSELDKELTETEDEHFKLQIEVESRQSHSTSRLNDLRKQRARIKTFKRKLEMAEKVSKKTAATAKK